MILMLSSFLIPERAMVAHVMNGTKTKRSAFDTLIAFKICQIRTVVTDATTSEYGSACFAFLFFRWMEFVPVLFVHFGIYLQMSTKSIIHCIGLRA